MQKEQHEFAFQNPARVKMFFWNSHIFVPNWILGKVRKNHAKILKRTKVMRKKPLGWAKIAPLSTNRANDFNSGHKADTERFLLALYPATYCLLVKSPFLFGEMWFKKPFQVSEMWLIKNALSLPKCDHLT